MTRLGTRHLTRWVKRGGGDHEVVIGLDPQGGADGDWYAAALVAGEQIELACGASTMDAVESLDLLMRRREARSNV